MSIIRDSKAEWQGDLTSGEGFIDLGSGVYSGPYTFKSRLEERSATNPEELIAAAHAGCFSMALSAELTKLGAKDINIRTKASVTLQQNSEGFYISGIHLFTKATVQNINDTQLRQTALHAKKNCPVSRALSAIEISLTFNDVELK